MKGGRLKSSIPGLVDLPSRDYASALSDGFLEGRRQVDGAENLWRVDDALYDLEEFMGNHPGGAEWLSLTRGTDITELFETHHLSKKPENMLRKFYIREAKSPRAVPLTFKPNGFYRTFKARAVEALKNVDYHRPSLKTNLIADTVLLLTLLFCLISAATQSTIAQIISGMLMTWTTIIGHNYFHMRDNFRMYYFDVSLMSSREWRITHAMSHHMYPNTLWDHEIYVFEPIIQWLPRRDKPLKFTTFKFVWVPIIWFLNFYFAGTKRYVVVLFKNKNIEFRDVVPFLIPLAMSLFAKTILSAVGIWLTIVAVSSFIFSFIGFNAAHHHPKIFHDGDVFRDELDWGLLELDTVRDRDIIDDSHFLVMTNFGLHALHHLLPTVDHAYLPLCLPALRQTCQEFNINNDRFSQLELIRGQFAQLSRTWPERNTR